MALLFELRQKVTQGFTALWTRYPVKKSKQDAEKAFGQVVKTPEIEEQIHAALDWQIPEWEAAEWYTPPLLGTYLRKARYTDEPMKPKTPTAIVNRHTATPMVLQQMDAAARIRSLIQAGIDPDQAKQTVYRELGWVK